MTAGTTDGSGRLVAGKRALGAPGGDVVSIREYRQHLAEMLRRSVGFRVDCPEGRVGVVTAVVPEYGDVAPDHIEIRSGLFIVSTVSVSFSDVVGVDGVRRRVSIRVVPERRRVGRREIARRVRRFLRAGGR
jgi:hypothetical protein